MRFIGMTGCVWASSKTATSLAPGRKQRIAKPLEPEVEAGWGPRIERGSQWSPWTNCSACSNERCDMRTGLFPRYLYGTDGRAIMEEENVWVSKFPTDCSGQHLVRVALCYGTTIRIMSLPCGLTVVPWE